MAELQTVSAVFELTRIAFEVSRFLRKVKNADKIVLEAGKRVNRLRGVLHGIEAAIERHEEDSSTTRSDLEIVDRIKEHVEACTIVLQDMKHKITRPGTNGNSIEIDGKVKSDCDLAEENTKSIGNLFERIRIVFRQRGIIRQQSDLEAFIGILQTDLCLLHVSGQANTNKTLRANHEEVLVSLRALEEQGTRHARTDKLETNQGEIRETLYALRAQLNAGNKLLNRLIGEREDLSPIERDAPSGEHHADDQVKRAQDALESLSSVLRFGEEFHEKYSSEYQPDIRSHRLMESQMDLTSPPVEMTPRSRAQSQESICSHVAPNELSEHLRTVAVSTDSDADDDSYPLREIVIQHISGYLERAEKEKDFGHFNQAELNLQAAIGWAQVAEKRYGIPFEDRHVRQEEVAFLYQKQHKFGEAVRVVSQLLRENGDVHSYARQHQLLASIYLEWHGSRSSSASLDTDDIKNANKHATKAVNQRFKINPTRDEDPDEFERHQSCIELLIRILEMQDKPIEAASYSKLLVGRDGSPVFHTRTPSYTSYPRPNLSDLDRTGTQQSLIAAIERKDSEAVQDILFEGNIDVNRPFHQGATALMHAVEHGNESIVNKLLDTEMGVHVDAHAQKGITALHRAAELGEVGMILCLLKHDASIDLKDSNGETALIKAVKNDQRTVIKTLEERGANMAARTREDWSLLHHSVHFAKVETTKCILNLDKELRHAVDYAGKTALHHCASDPKLLEQARVLLEHRNACDINAVDSISRSPIFLAASHPATPSRERMVALLAKHGARLDPKKLPPRYRDYESLNPRQSTQGPARQNSGMSIDGSIHTDSSEGSRWSYIFSSRKAPKPRRH